MQAKQSVDMDRSGCRHHQNLSIVGGRASESVGCFSRCHGEKDFRVPVTQGIEAFTAAQVQDVPSRFLYFPEEGHWVQSPQNGVLWHRIFFDWLGRYCKDPTPVSAEK